MRGRWFGPPRGGHRIPAPGTLLAEADAARVRAGAPTATFPKVAPPADTLAFDTPGSWTGPLPVRAPASKPPSLETPQPVVTEVVFHRSISWELRRDHAQLPLFREAVKAHGGFAGLHMRAPKASNGGES